VQAGDSDPLINILTVESNPDGFPNDVDTSCQHSVDLVHPDFAVTKVCEPKEIVLGQDITWTINLENTGDIALNVCCYDETVGIPENNKVCVDLPAVAGPVPLTGSPFSSATASTGDITNTVSCEATLVGVPLGNIVGPRTASDTCTVETCSVNIIKETSCDGGANWGDGCSALDTAPVSIRYRYENTGSADLFDCGIEESNTTIADIPRNDTGSIDLPSGGGLIPNLRITDQCSTVWSGGEPDTATITCDCGDPDEPLMEVSATDGSDFTCETCQVEIDKQVSCDGANWFDDTAVDDIPSPDRDGVGQSADCSELNGQNVHSRYIVSNLGTTTVQCSVSDDNTLFNVVGDVTIPYQGGPATVGSFTAECNDGFEGQEPNTGSIQCDCLIDDVKVAERTDSDIARIECLGCFVEVDKAVSCAGGDFVDVGFQTEDGDGAQGCSGSGNDNITIQYRARNTGEVGLENCTLTETNLALEADGVVQSGFTIAFEGTEGPILDDDQSCSDEGIDVDEPDTAEVTCECADPAGDDAPVEVSAYDRADFMCVAEGCLIIIDEDGIDNGMYNIEQAARYGYCNVGMSNNDYLVNDKDWLYMGGFPSPMDPWVFPAQFPDGRSYEEVCEEIGESTDRKLPTKCGNPALLWNLIVDDNPGCEGPWLLPTGQVDDEAYFALPPQISYADERPSHCYKYVGNYDLFVEEFVLGIVPQECLDKVRDVMPLRNQDLAQLVGRTCTAVVYDSDINMDYRSDRHSEPGIYANLQGERYGLFHFIVEGVEVAGSIPENMSSTSLYGLQLRIIEPQVPGEAFHIVIHDHEPDACEAKAWFADYNDGKLYVKAWSDMPGPDTDPTAQDEDDWMSYMTLSVDGEDDGLDWTVDPFLLEEPMKYKASRGVYKFKLMPVVDGLGNAVDLDGRRMSVQTDEGCAYNIYIR
jgi:hypothetical protein